MSPEAKARRRKNKYLARIYARAERELARKAEKAIEWKNAYGQADKTFGNVQLLELGVSCKDIKY